MSCINALSSLIRAPVADQRRRKLGDRPLGSWRARSRGCGARQGGRRSAPRDGTAKLRMATGASRGADGRRLGGAAPNFLVFSIFWIEFVVMATGREPLALGSPIIIGFLAVSCYAPRYFRGLPAASPWQRLHPGWKIIAPHRPANDYNQSCGGVARNIASGTPPVPMTRPGPAPK